MNFSQFLSRINFDANPLGALIMFIAVIVLVAGIVWYFWAKWKGHNRAAEVALVVTFVSATIIVPLFYLNNIWILGGANN